jgi:hypothetical protein
MQPEPYINYKLLKKLSDQTACGVYKQKTVDQRVRYNAPFDFTYKTYGKSGVKGQCK